MFTYQQLTDFKLSTACNENINENGHVLSLFFSYLPFTWTSELLSTQCDQDSFVNQPSRIEHKERSKFGSNTSKAQNVSENSQGCLRLLLQKLIMLISPSNKSAFIKRTLKFFIETHKNFQIVLHNTVRNAFGCQKAFLTILDFQKHSQIYP